MDTRSAIPSVTAEELQPRVWWCFTYEQEKFAKLHTRSKSLPHLRCEQYPDSNYVTTTRVSGAKLHHVVAEQHNLQFQAKQGIPNPYRQKNKKTKKTRQFHNISVQNCTDNACTEMANLDSPYPGHTVATPICPKTIAQFGTSHTQIPTYAPNLHLQQTHSHCCRANHNPPIQPNQGIPNACRCVWQLTQNTKKDHHHHIWTPNCSNNACTLQ